MASLQKYSGTWSERHAAHLLRRTTFSVPYKVLKQAGNQSLDDIVSLLLMPLPTPQTPVNDNFQNDPDVPVGETWVTAPVTLGVNGYRQQSLRRWSLKLMLSDTPNIREKMTLFWHNHFVTAQINDPRFSYFYIEKLRAACLGDFKQMTKDMTIDVAMLLYLNGNENTRQAPNENYARELLELFTVGKGESAGPGDYTTFTEDDVKEMARSLTGWTFNRREFQSTGVYVENRHDTGTKQLSHRFGSKTIDNMGENEYSHLIDVIFENETVAHHIVTKLYRWFVHHEITDEIESDIIRPLATLFRDNNYQIKPVLETLLKSEHFYDECIRGIMIKSPLDFVVNPLNQFEVAFPTVVNQDVTLFNDLYNITAAFEMGLFDAPDVAGWKAYYQEPNFDRLWLNATSLPGRKVYSDAIATVGLGRAANRTFLDLLSTVQLFDSPDNPEHVIQELELLLFSKPLAENQRNTLLNIINVNLPEGWKTVYNIYSSDPQNERNRNQVVNILRALVVYMMRMPEYHLS